MVAPCVHVRISGVKQFVCVSVHLYSAVHEVIPKFTFVFVVTYLSTAARYSCMLYTKMIINVY